MLQYPFNKCEEVMTKYRKLAKEKFFIGTELSSVHFVVTEEWNVESFTAYGTDACDLELSTEPHNYMMNGSKWTSSAMLVPEKDFLVWVHYVEYGKVLAISQFLNHHTTPAIFSVGYVMKTFDEYSRHCNMLSFKHDDDKENPPQKVGEDLVSTTGAFGFSFWSHPGLRGLYLQPRWKVDVNLNAY